MYYVCVGELNLYGGYVVVKEVLKNEEIIVIFCGNDEMVMGVY